MRDKKTVIEDMVDKSYNILDCHFDDNKMILHDIKRKKFIEFQTKFESDIKT